MIFNFLRLACFQLACHIPTVGQVGVVEAASIKCGGGGGEGGGGGGQEGGHHPSLEFSFHSCLCWVYSSLS